MIDIAVKDLVKSFEIGDNLLDGLTFEVQEGQCVAILGRNGCGKTTLFRILTGEIGYDEGEVYVNPNKKLGLISQIPRYPAGIRWRRCSVPPSGSFWRCGSGWRNWNPR